MSKNRDVVEENAAKPTSRVSRRQLVMGALLVGALALGGVNLALHLDRPGEDPHSEARTSALKSATERVPKMFSYSYQSFGEDVTDAGNQLTGDFREQYVKLLRKNFGPQVRRDKLTNQVTVVDAGVISASSKEAEVLVFLDVSTTSGNGGAPRLMPNQVQVTLQKVDKEWLIASMQPVS